LTFLDLENNHISSIESSDFTGLTSLTSLHLEENQISSIESGAFSGLPTLNWVNLDYNSISSIEPGSFSGPTNLSNIYLNDNQITSIESGVFSGLTDLRYLYLNDNQISSIESGAFSGLTALWMLLLGDNTSMTTLNMEGAEFSELDYFDIGGNTNLTSVSLKNAVLNQRAMEGLSHGTVSPFIGIAELPGIYELDMSGVDFSLITDLSSLYTMDDLEELLLAGASNLDGAQVSALTGELDSLNWLDVTGPWDTFGAGVQSSLNAWDAIEGNTLVTPEPATMALLALGGLTVLKRRRRV
jgi:Leucine-rich repeat (LRR) protein